MFFVVQVWIFRNMVQLSEIIAGLRWLGAQDVSARAANLIVVTGVDLFLKRCKVRWYALCL